MIDELAAWRPPGSQDCPRAALLAMLGRFDEAWPLAEARSSHLREMTGNHLAGRRTWYLWLIATIEGDRERACRYSADMLEVMAISRVPAATAKGRLARDLCYLGRFDEAERLLEEARAVPPPVRRSGDAAASAEALLLAHRGELEQAEALARDGSRDCGDQRRTTSGGRRRRYEDLAIVLERAGRTDDARAALERARSRSGSGSSACPARTASVNRSTWSRGRSSSDAQDVAMGREGFEPSTLGLRVPCSTN